MLRPGPTALDGNRLRCRSRGARNGAARRSLSVPMDDNRPQATYARADGDDAARSVAGIAFLERGGEMGRRMRAFDWAATPLGPPRAWPQSLRTVVRILLDSRYAMWMLWGPDLTFF